MTPRVILLIAALDTKAEEALFVRRRIEARGHRVLLLDAGTLGPPGADHEISRFEAARCGGGSLTETLATGDKAACVATMARGAAAMAVELHGRGRIDGVMGLGGAQGTEIACTAMRALPVGVPKLMVSTVASGQATFGPFVGTSDVMVMHSVADLQGINVITSTVLARAAAAICGMVEAGPLPRVPARLRVALSMLGTTTPGALRAKTRLEAAGCEVVTFHQNGTGGIAMEEMIEAGMFAGVLDLALHEIADALVGGQHSPIRAGRLEAAGARGIPQVVAPGGINYMVAGPLATLAGDLRGRRHVVHNASLTLVRLTPAELRRAAGVVAERLSRARGPVRVFIPRRGFCFPDRDGQPLWEPEGNAAFVESLRTGLGNDVVVTELDAHINDASFADRVAASLMELLPLAPDARFAS